MIDPSKARRLLEDLVLRDDGFGIARLNATLIPESIVTEAWSPEKKEQMIKKGDGLGFHMVDHVITGDYDLALWHTSKLEGYPHAYVVSINNAERDPLDAANQKTKFATHTQFHLNDIKAKLAEWVNDYGSVLIGSVDTTRNERYYRLIARTMRGYKLSPYWQNNLRYGFKLEKQ